MGRKIPAHRSGMGARGARRFGREGIRLGGRIHLSWAPHGEHLARTISLAQSCKRSPSWGRIRRHGTGWFLSSKRFWPLRHGRQCLGMDDGLVPGSRSEKLREILLRSREPAWRTARGKLRPSDAEMPHSPQSGQGRVVSLRAKLLPALGPAARQPQMVDSAMSHIGFRCIIREPKKAQEET